MSAGAISLKKSNIDMTMGSIVKNIIVFAIPLLLGNLFQQLYNMVDTYVIGQTGVNEAYAAVGSVAPIINILIGTFMGLSSGVGVVISQNYGAKNYQEVKKATHTAILLTLVLCVVFTVIGLVTIPLFLNIILNSKEGGEAIYPHAQKYLSIYFLGVSGLLIYNMGSGILRAIGDSKRPFYYLVVSAVINIILDVVFVFSFNMGVEGVALATIIAQGVSATLTLITLFFTTTCVKIDIKSLKFDKSSLFGIFKLGTPAAIQMALTAFSNMFVMSYISNVNGNTTYALSGWTTYSKVDQIIFLPMQSIALSVSTFVGQNLGIGDVKRAKKGTNLAFLIALISTVLLIIPIMIFAPQISWMFNKDGNVIEYSTLFLRYLTPFYVCCTVNQVFTAALRGAGNSKTPMIFMLTSFIVIRQIYLFITSNFISNDPIPIGFSFPVGWVCCAIGLLIYYKSVKLEKFRIVKTEQTICNDKQSENVA